MTTRTIDLLDGALYAGGPYETYAWMREHAPAYWDSTNELWGISRLDDVVEIEKHKDLFINSDQTKGGYRPNIPADPAMIGLDDPLHQQRRSLVSRRFTPKAVSAWEPDIRAKVTTLLDGVASKGGRAEVIGDLAAPLPAMMIGKLLGFSEDRWHDLQVWSERTIFLGGGPRYFNDDGVLAAAEFAVAAQELHADRKGCPMVDVMSGWAGASIDDRPLSVADVQHDGLLLLDGGAETTRTVIARTLLNLIAFPEEWARLKDGADMTVAVEEFIRFVTPIHNMCRVATVDYDIAGVNIAKGHQVVLMYGAANRDPAHFDDPERMDVGRHPNNHIAFGFGTHFCLGAALARLELRVFFEELVRRVDHLGLDPAAPPEEMPNAFVYGLKSAHIDMEFAP